MFCRIFPTFYRAYIQRLVGLYIIYNRHRRVTVWSYSPPLFSPLTLSFRMYIYIQVWLYTDRVNGGFVGPYNRPPTFRNVSDTCLFCFLFFSPRLSHERRPCDFLMPCFYKDSTGNWESLSSSVMKSNSIECLVNAHKNIGPFRVVSSSPCRGIYPPQSLS